MPSPPPVRVLGIKCLLLCPSSSQSWDPSVSTPVSTLIWSNLPRSLGLTYVVGATGRLGTPLPVSLASTGTPSYCKRPLSHRDRETS